jgi:3-hydroxybutyryl-CoA dehydratase
MLSGDADSASRAPDFRSLTIDELDIGDVAESTRHLTSEDILSFARITGDFNPIHVDPVFAESTRFGRIIAHGPLALALAGEIVGTRLPGLGTIALSSTIRHRLPIYADDVVTTRAVVSALDRDAKTVRLALTWTNQNRELVGEGETTVSPPRTPVRTSPTGSRAGERT